MATKQKPAAKKSMAAKKTAAGTSPLAKTGGVKKTAAKPLLAKTSTSAAKKAVNAKAKTAEKPKAMKKVAPIPKGYSSITPYLLVRDATKAIGFYQKVFGAKIIMKMDKPGGKIGHCELKIGDSMLMLADEMPDMGMRGPSGDSSGVTIHLYTKNVDNVVKEAVSSGAKVIMPVQDMFYGDRSGAVQDPFGHRWHIATHIENVSPATLKKRMAEMSSKKG